MLLDNQNPPAYMNYTPMLGELSADDYYMTTNNFNILPLYERNTYIWNQDIYGGVGKLTHWDYPYQQVLYSNIVLEGLKNIQVDNSNTKDWNNIKGTALFMRAFAFWNLAQIFCAPYDSATANTDLGIPLRLSSDINEKSSRSTIQQTYDQIISDLSEAENLVPPTLVYSYRNRPSKPAVLAMMARTYLSMRNYGKALLYSDSSLQLYNKLIDYNTISTAASIPFPLLNDEALFSARDITTGAISNLRLSQGNSIDTSLYQSYDINDLRKRIYFRLNGPYVTINKGTYNATSVFRFTGLATDEVYLMRAESYARLGDKTNSLNDLNILMSKRFKTGTFVPFTAATANDALSLVLNERRKELVMRNLRWTDLRRLNKEGFNITLIRIINNQTYTLKPNDPRYILPIPDDVIAFTGMQQNAR
jgi:hypothetical protein